MDNWQFVGVLVGFILFGLLFSWLYAKMIDWIVPLKDPDEYD